MKKFLRLMRYVKAYWKYAVLNVCFNILFVLFSLVSLLMIIPFLNFLFLKDDSEYTKRLGEGISHFHLSIQSVVDNFYFYLSEIIVKYGKPQALVFICIIVVTLFFLKNFFRYLAMYFLAPIRNGVVKDIRSELYHKILHLPLSYFSEEKKGNLISTMTNDVQEVEWSVMSSLEAVFREPLAVASSLIAMTIISPQLTAFVLILLPITAIIIGRIGRSLKKTSVKGQAQLGILLTIIEETLSGLRIIKAFTAELFSIGKFSKVNDDYNKLAVKIYRKKDLSAPLSEFLGAVVLVTVMYFGGILVLKGTGGLEAAMFIGFVAIFSQVIPPAKSFATAFYNIQKGIASAERINKILDAEIIIREKTNASAISKFTGEIEYRNVSFAYVKGDIGWVLKDIHLKIPKGKTIALVGQSGAGKSTLADLLPRFYDPTHGDILIDGVPIKDLKISDLRKLMGVVTQESILFNDTIFNNIAFGMNHVKEEDVITAAKIANAHGFIMETENGYQSNIGDRGGKLSGGQRQRLSIARAILKNPPILILDEATSALDTESERLVQEALQNLVQNRTSLIIAHRLSTIQHADEIIVLQKGQIAERGKHAELLQQNGVYKKLYDLQSFV